MTIKFLKSLNPYHDAGNTALKAAGFKHLMSNFFSIWIVHVDQCLPALVLSLLVLHWRGWLQLYVMVLFLISGQYLYLYIARGTFMCVSVYCDVPNSHSKPRRSELFRSIDQSVSETSETCLHFKTSMSCFWSGLVTVTLWFSTKASEMCQLDY